MFIVMCSSQEEVAPSMNPQGWVTRSTVFELLLCPGLWISSLVMFLYVLALQKQLTVTQTVLGGFQESRELSTLE